MSSTTSTTTKLAIKRTANDNCSHFVRKVFRFTYIILPATIFGGSRVVGKQSPSDRYQNFKQAQIHSTDCNKALAGKMQAVASAFAGYRAQHGHFPEEGKETETMQKRLSMVAGINAFAGFELLLSPATAAADTEQTTAIAGFGTPPRSVSTIDRESARSELTVAASEQPVPNPLTQPDLPTAVKVKVDMALSSIMLESFKSALPGSWHAEPGTITVVHNTENYFLVWGAGLDGKPIIADGKKTALMITPERD